MCNEVNEEWFPVPEYEGFYSITKDGRVRSETRTYFQQGRWQTYKGRELKPWKSTTGYFQIGLSKPDAKHKKFFIHQLVLKTFVGRQEDGMDVRHLNGNPLDNRLENLAYGTRRENIEDAIKHGTMGIGLRDRGCKHYKITSNQAINIAKDPRPYKLIALDYHISDRHVASIKRGEYWGDITEGIRVTWQKRPFQRSFTQDEINEIITSDKPKKELASKFNTSVGMINKIRRQNIVEP